MAAFLQKEEVRIELNLALETTLAIYTNTTLNSSGYSLQADTNEIQASPLFQQHCQGSWLQQAGLLVPPFPTVPHRLGSRIDVRPHGSGEGFKRAYHVSYHCLFTATSFFFSDTSLAQAKERGVILSWNKIDFFLKKWIRWNQSKLWLCHH